MSRAKDDDEEEEVVVLHATCYEWQIGLAGAQSPETFADDEVWENALDRSKGTKIMEAFLSRRYSTEKPCAPNLLVVIEAEQLQHDGAMVHLRDMLEKAYSKAGGSRRKKSIARISLVSLGWSESHQQAFDNLQKQLQDSTKLIHRNMEKTLCVHTDASDLHWAVCATQCDSTELEKAPQLQVHEPLAFISGSFTEREAHWSTYEREAFAIVQAFKRLDYLLACDKSTRIFTDHRNLLFTFNPVAMEPSLGRHKVLKVIRWALFLSAFNYRIEHVPGDCNIWPDIMTRWMRGYRKPPAIRRISSVIPFIGVVQSPNDSEFTWPSSSEISKIQSRASAPKNSITTGNGILELDGLIWIPDNAIDLKLRLITIAHAGTAAHRGADSTYHALHEIFYWKNMRADVRSFVAECLLCVMSKSGEKVPRPLASTAHASSPNEIIHFDYLYLGQSSNNSNPMKYVLVIKDDLSSYCWLETTFSANAEHVAEVLARWTRVFGSPKIWVSDQGSHFKNEVVSYLARLHHIRHHHTVAYSPWANGTVESLMRSILAATRSLLAEWKLAPTDWTSIIPTIATALNEANIDRLGYRENGTARTPLEVMTGIVPLKPISQVVQASTSIMDAKVLSAGKAFQLVKIDKLQESLQAMHKEVSMLTMKRRARAISAHNKATNLISPSFAIGDFVLVRRATDRGHKLKFKWSGPKRITAIHSPLVYGISSLRGGTAERVHCTRMIKYNDGFLGKEVPKEILELADMSESRYEIAEKITDVGEDNESLFLRVQWEGLPDERDWTWHSLSDLFTDIPDMVKEFLSAHPQRKELIQKCKRQLLIE
ncbi:MAG: RNase H-like domain-containing protein [Cyanobacteria bacterium P01_H01_bin.15]